MISPKLNVNKIAGILLISYFISISLAFSQNFPPSDFDTQPNLAFPGAEGFGKYATGGRGGVVYIVTNLNDSGQGSLREALEAREPRVVVFEVSGTIDLKSQINVRHGNLTVAGQTAPGDGITIRNYPIIVRDSQNVIFRYIRSRLGDLFVNDSTNPSINEDAFTILNSKNVIIDHCSFSWSTDEVLGIERSYDITIQNSIISEPLAAYNPLGSLNSGDRLSYYKNVYAHARIRNPAISHLVENGLHDIRNILVYNWGFRAIDGGAFNNINIINSYFKPGPATLLPSAETIISQRFLFPTRFNDDPKTYGKFFLSGNFMPTIDLSRNQWLGVRLESSDLTSQFLESLKNKDSNGNLIPFSIPENLYSENLSAQVAYNEILTSVGASHKRDLVDERIINEVRNGIATFKNSRNGTPGIIHTQRDVGGWPSLKTTQAPLDSDRDGMPDAWEIANGLNPNEPDDKGFNLSPYYTNIEIYINSIVKNPINKVPSRVVLTLPSQNGINVVPVDVSFAWTPLSNAQSYTLQLSKVSDFSSGVTTVNNITNHSIVYPALDPNSTYFWRVRARNSSGNGPYSVTGTFRTSSTNTVPGRTVLLGPGQDAQGVGLAPLFTWAQVPNAKSYRIQVSTTSDFSSLVINQSNLPTNQFQATVRLLENRTYFWRVRASNDTGYGSNSVTGTFRTVNFNTSPTPVVAISPFNGVAVNPVNVQLQWVENPTAERYQIQVSQDPNFQNSIISSSNFEGGMHVIPTLASNTVYYWRIRGVNRSGNGNFSSVYQFKTKAFSEKPEQVILANPVHDSNIFSTSIQFTWEADPIAQSYRFQLSTNPNFSSFVSNVGGLTGTSRTVSNLTTNRDYYWRVQALNEAGAGEFSEVRKVRAATFSGTPPATNLISPFNESVVGATTVLFSWENQPNTEFYRLEVSEQINFSSTVLVRNSIRGTSIAIEGLQANKTYFWRIRTSNPAGTGQRSEIWSFRTVSTEINLYPTTLIAPQKAATFQNPSISFAWERVSEATAYHLQVSERSDFSSIAFQNQTINATSFSLSTLTSGKVYFWRVRVRNGSIFSAWSDAWNFSIGSQDNLLNMGLVGYWPMEEGSGNRMLDQSGNNLHATIQNTSNVTWVAGKEGKAINLNGNTGRFGVVPHQAVLNIPNAITLAAWVRPAEVGRGTILHKNPGNGFELWLDSSGLIEFRLNRGSNGSTYRLLSKYNYSTDVNKWIHVAATFDGTTSTIYINGNEDATATYAPFQIGTTSGELTIGALGTIQRWRGDLDEVRLYNRSLNRNEILMLVGLMPDNQTSSPSNNTGLVGHWKMDEGSGNQMLDDSGNQFHAIIGSTDGISWGVGVLGQALSLPGTSNRFGTVNHNSKLALPNAISISAWVNPSQLGRSTIISKADGNGFELWLDINGFIEFRLNRGNNNSTYRLRSNFNYSQAVGKWFHLVATFDGQSSKIFINGIEDISETYQPFSIGTNSGDLVIGALGTIQRFNGKMDDLRLYDKALTSSEIQQITNLSSNNRLTDDLFTDYLEGLQLGIIDDVLESINPELPQKPVLFPNPVDREVSVARLWKSDGQVQVIIYDVRGAVLSEQTLNLTDSLINIQLQSLQLKPGYYMLTVQDKMNREIFRFIKK
ncbi:MAG: LamG-like jellyroll fold domain-containing protein [Mongoliitalea sp.]